MPWSPTAPKLILAEGKEDVLFIEAMIRHLRLTGIEVKEYGGKQQLRGFLGAIVRSPSFHSRVVTLAITRDADESAEDAWRSVAGAIQAAGLSAVPGPGLRGPGKPAAAVFIFPGQDRPGMLEDLCVESVRDTREMTCVDEFAHCLESLETPAREVHSKARLQAFLAAQRRPGLRVGEAAAKGVWPLDAPAFSAVRDFLRVL